MARPAAADPKAAAPAFRTVPPPFERGPVANPHEQNARGVSATEHEWSAFKVAVEAVSSAETHMGLVEKCQTRCDHCGARVHYAARDGRRLDAPRCDSCCFARFMAAVRSAHDGLVDPAMFDPRKAERARLEAEYPSIAAGLPPVPEPTYPGPLGPKFASVLVPQYGLGYGHGELLEKVGRFASGDFGDHGHLDDAAPGDLAKWLPALGSELERSALAVAAGEGLVTGRYPVSDRSVDLLMIQAGMRDPRSGRPVAHVDVLGLLRAGRLAVVAAPSSGRPC